MKTTDFLVKIFFSVLILIALTGFVFARAFGFELPEGAYFTFFLSGIALFYLWPIMVIYALYSLYKNTSLGKNLSRIISPLREKSKKSAEWFFEKKIRFISCLILILVGYVVFANIKNKSLDGCTLSNATRSDFQGGEYLVTPNSVCYHKDCSFYDGIDYRKHLCYWDKKLFGYREIDGTDPETFVQLPIFAVDKNGFYENGKRLAKKDLGRLSFNLGYLMNYCDIYTSKGYDSTYSLFNSQEKLDRVCKLFQESFDEGKDISKE